MIVQLRIKNFRGFENHKLDLRPLTVMVGVNNAGKSTVAEALRLVSLVCNRYKSLNFHPVPGWLDRPRRERGVSPSLRGMDFNFETVFHRYSNPPAQITAVFENKAELRVYLGPEGQLHASIKKPNGDFVVTKGQAQSLELPSVQILPQVAPVSSEERVLNDEYVRSNLSSRLAPLHFRNQLKLLFSGFFKEFKSLAEKTWRGLQVRDLETQGRGPLHERTLTLLLRDHDFVGELGLMGHGLQIWLQIVWFLARSREADSVILDEPDVYLHADLQRRLMRVLKGRFRQIIITTHSPEIMSEVDPDAILNVNRRKPSSVFVSGLPGVQTVVDGIGSVHNIGLARLAMSQRLLLVEGKDLKILSTLHNTLFPSSEVALDSIPNMPLGGWGGWSYAIGSSMTMKNALGQKIYPYCILDSDYHTDAQKTSRLEEAGKHGVRLHIWKQKEIENYLLVPSTISRIIAERVGKGKAPSEDKVLAELERIAGEMKEEITDSIASELQIEDRKLELKGARRKAQQLVNGQWSTWPSKSPLLPGKEVLSKLSDWGQSSYKTSFNARQIALALHPNEIDPELRRVLKAIDQLREL